MASKLFSLFDDRLKFQGDLVAGDAQSLSTISRKPEEQQSIIHRLQQFEIAQSKVDYSDYKNFVFFNSALDYFNITGEKIINEYPFDGSRDVIENFIQDLDGFQQYIVNIWPKNTSRLNFNPSISGAFVSVLDSGKTVQSSQSTLSTAQVGILSPGTGSISIELWCQASASVSNSNAMVMLQKTNALGDGYSVYLSASSVVFRVSSGSTSSEVTASYSNGNTNYFAFVYDRSNTANPQLIIYSGAPRAFPVLASQVTASIAGPINIGVSPLYIASGSLAGKVTQLYSGSLDEVRLWSLPLTLANISGTFNIQAYAQTNLVGLWHFNESGSVNPDDGNNALVLDSSGRRLNGSITKYYSGLRGSGSLIPYARPDLIPFYNAPEIQALILDKQTSGSLYDRVNDNIITRLIPEQFLVLENIANTTVIQNFLYVLARQFDYLKVRIDQFVNVLRTNYGQFNQAPDALLADVGRFFGWEFTGNFLNADAFQYLLGKNVLQNVDANNELDVKLYQIKNEFWKRTLINLMYLYKSKGTRESIEGLLRVYGVNRNFVRIKEYGYKPYVGIKTFRIHSEKSAHAMLFSSASVSFFPGGFPILRSGSTLQSSVTSNQFIGNPLSIETRCMFPTTASLDNIPVISTGSVWTLNAANLSGGQASGSIFPAYQLYWIKNGNNLAISTGSLIFSGTEGVVILANANVFDNRWYNITCFRDSLSGTMNIDVRRIDRDHVDLNLTASIPINMLTASLAYQYVLGSTGSFQSQMWTQENRIWNKSLTPTELQDHAMNFQSYGVENIGDAGALLMHWRLRENVTGSIDTTLPNGIVDVSGQGVSGSAFGFQPGIAPYKKFLEDFNYIASTDFSWNEEKIRTINSFEVKPQDAFSDSQTLALEFNMVDALNEDISQILATMDSFNNAIGMPVNRYRGTYPDIDALRAKYFSRLQGRLNFRVFADMLEFFDRSFIEMVKRLIPARTAFIGDEFVIESHMLERPKLQWNYRRQIRPFMPEGVIKVFVRT